MKEIVLAFLVVSAPYVLAPRMAAAQGLANLEGRWLGSCPGCAPGVMPGGFAKTLVIRVSASAIAIQQDGLPAEVYQLDGSETQLSRRENGNGAGRGWQPGVDDSS